jgi:hypothetical protein
MSRLKTRRERSASLTALTKGSSLLPLRFEAVAEAPGRGVRGLPLACCAFLVFLLTAVAQESELPRGFCLRGFLLLATEDEKEN